MFHSKLYPSGDFSVGIRPREKKLQSDEIYDKTHSIIHAVETKLTGVTRYYHDDSPNTLGSSLLPNSHNKPKTAKVKRGSKGITSHGKRMIRSAATLLQRAWTRKRTGFLTFTLPGLDEVSLWFLSTQWSEIVRKLVQELRRELKRKGADSRIIGVTEIQPERWARRGEVAPHLHFIYKAHSGNYNWYLPAAWLRSVWKRIIENTLQQEIGAVGASVDCQLVKKDAARYLGKYMSKGGEVVEEIITAGYAECLPSHWWHMDSLSRKMVKDRIVRDTGSLAEWLFYNAQQLVDSGMSYYCVPVTIPDRARVEDRVSCVDGSLCVSTCVTEPRDRIVGWAGRLKLEYVSAVLSLRK